MDLSIVGELTEEDLTRLGVVRLGHR